MTYKKKCVCGFVISAASKPAVVAAIRDHCEHTNCNIALAKDA